MATVKVVLWTHRAKNDGTYPVRIEIIHDRKRSTKTLFSIHESDWDEKHSRVKLSHPYSSRYNRRITSELAKINDRIVVLEDEDPDFSMNDLITPVQKKKIVLVDCINEYADRKPPTNARKYHNVADKVKQFRPQTILRRVDTAFMQDFASWLRGLPNINSQVTINRYLGFLKTVLRDQYNKGNFHDRQVLAHRTPSAHAHKAQLSKEEVDQMWKLDLDTNLALSRDAFCLMVYMRGIRVSDALQLQHSNIKGTKAVFIEQKTQKPQEMTLRPRAMQIIERYRDKSLWYVLPLLMMEPSDPRRDQAFQKHIEVKTAQINKDLKVIAASAGIEKKVTTHVARHTFAGWASKADLNSREIQKLLNHSSLRVTEEYLDQLKNSSELDQAADKAYE